MPELSSLRQKVAEVSLSLKETISKSGHILIISRPTPDGIVSASMLANALLELGARFTIKYLDITSKLPGSLADFSAEHSVLIGLGEELTSTISGTLKTKCEIIDHNFYLGDVNGAIASNYGFSGMLETSSSTLTYLVVKEMVENPVKYSHLALVGSLGEHQDMCQKRSLCGLNEQVLQEAINAELVELKERPLFPRLYNLPLHESISLSIDPLIYNLSGDPDTVRAILQKAGIRLMKDGRWRTYEDLSKDERELLMNTLEPYFVVGGKKADSIIATSYILAKEDEHSPLKDARDYAYVLEATKPDPALGTTIVMGKRGGEVELAAKLMKKFLKEVIFATKSILGDERRLRFSENLAILMGEGVVNYNLANAVSYVMSRFPTLSSYITLLTTTFEAESIIILRKGVHYDKAKNLYKVAVEASKPHNAKVLGHEGYALILSSLAKQIAILRELQEGLKS